MGISIKVNVIFKNIIQKRKAHVCIINREIKQFRKAGHKRVTVLIEMTLEEYPQEYDYNDTI